MSDGTGSRVPGAAHRTITAGDLEAEISGLADAGRRGPLEGQPCAVLTPALGLDSRVIYGNQLSVTILVINVSHAVLHQSQHETMQLVRMPAYAIQGHFFLHRLSSGFTTQLTAQVFLALNPDRVWTAEATLRQPEHTTHYSMTSLGCSLKRIRIAAEMPFAGLGSSLEAGCKIGSHLETTPSLRAQVPFVSCGPDDGMGL